MSRMDDHYVDYYTPLVQDFVREVENLAHPDLERVPQPHLPLFGSGYERSALRLVIIGQDTRTWGDLRNFIVDAKKDAGSMLRTELREFRGMDFVNWGPRRQTFFGFVMMTLAALYGHADWGIMKKRGLREILDSFGWAEGNAAELYRSYPRKLGLEEKYWRSVRNAADRFNRVRHIIETLKPHAILVLYKGMNTRNYFDGYKYNTVGQVGRLTHYWLPEAKVDVFHAPHPGSMNRKEGTDRFRDKITELFHDRELAKRF